MIENTENLVPKLLNPLSLAFVGDSIYEILVRTYVVHKHGSLSANKLHNMAIKMVCAAAQAEVYVALEPILSEDEISILKRGRNANSTTAPKNARLSDYRRATGVEALFGYLYLQGNYDRIEVLFHQVIKLTEEADRGWAETGK